MPKQKVHYEQLKILIRNIEDFRRTAKGLSTTHDLSYVQFKSLLPWIHQTFSEWELDVKRNPNQNELPVKLYYITLPLKQNGQ